MARAWETVGFEITWGECAGPTETKQQTVQHETVMDLEPRVSCWDCGRGALRHGRRSGLNKHLREVTHGCRRCSGHLTLMMKGQTIGCLCTSV